MPPWAMSLLPPPRPPSFVIVSFMSAPMSKGWPMDCAKTTDGCGEVVASRAIALGERRVSFCASSLMKVSSRSANLRTMTLRPFASVSFSKQSGGLGCCEFFLRLLPLLAQRSNLVERFASLLRHVINMGREKCRGFGERREIPAGGGDGALSGDEFDAPSLTNFFYFSSRMLAICPVCET